VGGGGISNAWKLQSGDHRWFLKTGPAESLSMFDAEAAGLRELLAAKAVRVPEPIASGVAGANGYLLLEWIEFDGRDSDGRLGELLAEQHRCSKPRFGWHRDNTIGATPQVNTWNESWTDFYREHRLGYQLELAGRNGYGSELQDEGGRLMHGIPRFFEEYEPVPSLLHGDLWGGNHASAGGQPVIYDPAVYYGDRESDIAMTRLFGGFGDAFYQAYSSRWPLQRGHRERLLLYQLYHVLNHLNLFGRSYFGRSLELLSMLNRLAWPRQSCGASSDSSTT
jgi:fructosamine-3-kinase